MGGCGQSNDPFQNTCSVSTHEFTETVTDPGVGVANSFSSPLGWYSATQGEIGDLCDAVDDTLTDSSGNRWSQPMGFMYGKIPCNDHDYCYDKNHINSNVNNDNQIHFNDNEFHILHVHENLIHVHNSDFNKHYHHVHSNNHHIHSNIHHVLSNNHHVHENHFNKFHLHVYANNHHVHEDQFHLHYLYVYENNHHFLSNNHNFHDNTPHEHKDQHCHANNEHHGHSSKRACSRVCQSLDPMEMDYETCAKRTDVQYGMSGLALWVSIAEQAPALIVTVCAGYLIDRYGRKIALVVSAVSLLVSSAVYMLASVVRVPLWAFVLTGFFGGCCGGFALLEMAVSSYIAAVSTTASRTQYFMVQAGAFSVVMCVAPLLGGILAQEAGFFVVFAIGLAIGLVLLFYVIFVFPDVTVAAISEGSPKTMKMVLNDSVVTTFDVLRQLFSHQASIGIVGLLTIFSISANSGETIFLLYPAKMFGWRGVDIGLFASFLSIQRVLLLTLALPVIQSFRDQNSSKAKMSEDIFLLRFSIFMAAMGELCLGMSKTPTQFWASTLPVSLSTFASPSTKSILSTLLPASYQGRLFSSVQLFVSVTEIVSMFGINAIYQATVDQAPQTLFFVMSGLFGVGFVVSIVCVRRGAIEKMRVACGARVEEIMEETPLLA
ncbi:hypothetical protein HDU98_006235 [Podochytrium sp. JEL0797]|nr:hypothetical protein HDU98_006235 [Podochytrium sp. JEL0797]